MTSTPEGHGFGWLIAAVVVAGALSGCGASASGPAAPDRVPTTAASTPPVAGDGAAYASSLIPSTTANRIPSARAIEHLLPNRLFDIGGERPTSLSHAAVVGEVVLATEGVAHRLATGDKPATTSSFSDPRAAWRSVYLTVRIEEVLGESTLDLGAEVKVGVVIDGGEIDVERALASFADLGRAVFFVSDRTPRVDETNDVMWLAYEGGSTLGVGKGGSLTVALYKAEMASLAGLHLHGRPPAGPVPAGITLDELRDLADQPQQLVGAD